MVGIVAPATMLGTHAEKVIKDAYKAGGIEVQETVHANELIRHNLSGYQAVLQSIIESLRMREWQPVRLINSARIGYGDKTATYTNLVAELVIRVFETLSRRHPNTRLELNIVYASVFLGESPAGSPLFMEKSEYTARLSEYLTLAAVRRGAALKAASWSVKRIEYASGLRNRALQLCDHLSHASHDNFKNCFTEPKRALREAFATFDFNLLTPDAVKAIRNHLEEGAIVPALLVYFEASRQKDLAPWVKSQLSEYGTQIIHQLAWQGPPTRNANLRQLVDWVRQIVLARNLSLAAETIQWLHKQLLEHLTAYDERSVEDLAWFNFALTAQALSVNNHAGKLRDARECICRLKALMPEIAGHWEHAPLMMDAFILQAVHLNDAFAAAEAAQVMQTVADYYESLAGLMCDALPGVFPEKVRSYDRGRALGTLVQAEMYAALAEPTRLHRARAVSEEACREFSAEDDIRQQYQYRAQLETYAGNLPEARKFLALSIDAPDPEHATLAATIGAMPEMAAGFPLLHWSRIGMEGARQNSAPECTQFSAALKGSHILSSAWFNRDGLFYPSHGIRRHLAVFYAANEESDPALSILGRLLSLQTDEHEILTLIQISGALEVTASIGKNRKDLARKLINSEDPKKPGILRLCRTLDKKVQGFTEMQELIGRFEAAVAEFQKSDFKDGDEIRSLVRLVGQ